MARAFTLDFTYLSCTFSALITIVCKGEDAEYQVRLLNQELCELMPDGVFTLDKNLSLKKANALKSEGAKELVSCISSAISEHLLHEESLKKSKTE